MKKLKIEREFVLECEKRYLLKNPHQAPILALNYLEDFLNLSRDYRSLEQKYEKEIADNQPTSQSIEESSSANDVKHLTSKRNKPRIRVKIPYFLRCRRH